MVAEAACLERQALMRRGGERGKQRAETPLGPPALLTMTTGTNSGRHSSGGAPAVDHGLRAGDDAVVALP